MYMLLKNDKSNGGGNKGGNSNGNSVSKDKNKSNNGNGPDKDKINNGKSSNKPKNKDLSKEEREAKKDKVKQKKGYRKKGKYNNKGKHLGWYKNGKIPVGPNGEKVALTYYLNDVSNSLTQVLMTYGEEGNFNAAYTYGLERISVEAVDGTRPESQDPLYYLYDGLGSVTFMVKPDGNKRDHYRYDEFGKPAPGNSKLSQDGKNVLHNTFGYTGEMWDQEAELLYLRARYYEPETGRFLSRDSYWGNMQNPLSRNLYSYVQNNPVNFIDLSGYMSIWQTDDLADGAWSSAKDTVTDMIDLISFDTAKALYDIGEAIVDGRLSMGQLIDASVDAATEPFEYVWDNSSYIFGDDPTDAEVFEYGKQLGNVVLTVAGSGAAIKAVTKAVPSAAKLLTKLSSKVKTKYTRKKLDLNINLQLHAKGTSNVIRLSEEGIDYALSKVSRVRHGFDKHAKELGFSGRWGRDRDAWYTLNREVLSNPSQSFDHKLGPTAVKGFYKNVDGQDVVVFIYKEGQYQGQIATTISPSATQLANWNIK